MNDFVPSVEQQNEVKKRMWEQIHSRICCTLMTVHYSTRAILQLFPAFRTQATDDFFIDKPSYLKMKNKVFEFMTKKCSAGIHGSQNRNLLQFQCQLRRKIFCSLPFILSEYYFVPFLNSYIKYADVSSGGHKILSELLVKATKYYLSTCQIQYSRKSKQTQALIQPLVLINSQWKRNRKNCLKFQQEWNTIGTKFDFKLQTSIERAKGERGSNIARRVYKTLQNQCKEDFSSSLFSICQQMIEILDGTCDEIVARLLRSLVCKKEDVFAFENTYVSIFMPTLAPEASSEDISNSEIILNEESTVADMDTRLKPEEGNCAYDAHMHYPLVNGENRMDSFPDLQTDLQLPSLSMEQPLITNDYLVNGMVNGMLSAAVNETLPVIGNGLNSSPMVLNPNLPFFDINGNINGNGGSFAGISNGFDFGYFQRQRYLQNMLQNNSRMLSSIANHTPIIMNVFVLPQNTNEFSPQVIFKTMQNLH